MSEREKVPIHLQERRAWDSVLHRLRETIDELVPQFRDENYLTAGEEAQAAVEEATKALLKVYEELKAGRWEKALADVRWELRNAGWWLEAGEAAGGWETCVELPEEFRKEEPQP